MAVIYALLAAVFYAINTPFSKILLNDVPATYMAAFLYMGAGFGVGIIVKNIDQHTLPNHIFRAIISYDFYFEYSLLS